METIKTRRLCPALCLIQSFSKLSLQPDHSVSLSRDQAWLELHVQHVTTTWSICQYQYQSDSSSFLLQHAASILYFYDCFLC